MSKSKVANQILSLSKQNDISFEEKEKLEALHESFDQANVYKIRAMGDSQYFIKMMIEDLSNTKKQVERKIEKYNQLK